MLHNNPVPVQRETNLQRRQPTRHGKPRKTGKGSVWGAATPLGPVPWLPSAG